MINHDPKVPFIQRFAFRLSYREVGCADAVPWRLAFVRAPVSRNRRSVMVLWYVVGFNKKKIRHSTAKNKGILIMIILPGFIIINNQVTIYSLSPCLWVPLITRF